MKRIQLGDKVQDTVTGFKGVAIAAHEYLNGCRRISVQPKAKKDGTVPDSHTFDEPQLKIVTQRAVLPGPQDTGGPEKYMPKGRAGE